jgi:type II secretory ATPase GspE/PulE/Tfp pilus assembly ATPase PilB-like protein
MSFYRDFNRIVEGEYEFLRDRMEECTYLEMDALIKSLPHVPFISCRLEIQECTTCDVSHSHYHVSFKYNEDVSFSSRKGCQKCSGTVAESRKGLDEYCCIKCGDRNLAETDSMRFD